MLHFRGKILFIVCLSHHFWSHAEHLALAFSREKKRQFLIWMLDRSHECQKGGRVRLGNTHPKLSHGIALKDRVPLLPRSFRPVLFYSNPQRHQYVRLRLVAGSGVLVFSLCPSREALLSTPASVCLGPDSESGLDVNGSAYISACILAARQAGKASPGILETFGVHLQTTAVSQISQ